MGRFSKELILTLSTIALLFILFIFAMPVFIFGMVVLLVIAKLRFPQVKGAVGEAHVNRILHKLGPQYKLYHDLYLPNGKGGTTQVDHIVTSPYGIFVIETKHYEGWIFGSEKQRYWTQVIYKRKEKLYNPIWQNKGHVEALKSYLGKEDTKHIHSIIAFSNNSTFKFKEPFTAASVIQFSHLLKEIQQWIKPVWNNSEIATINQKLDRILITDKKAKRDIKKHHVQSINDRKKEKVLNEKVTPIHNSCPRCKGKLSLKKGKYGSFYGCSNYPKCRYTKKVS